MSMEPDPPNWSELYRQHQPAMYRFAAALLGSSRVAGPLDIVHDAFTSVMQNPPTGVDDWEALLIKVTKFRVFDHLKRADNKNTELADTTMGRGVQYDPASDDDVAHHVIRKAQAAAVRAQLQKILNNFSPQRRNVAELRILHSMPVTDIAAELNTSPANVSQLLRKALTDIAEQLMELDVSPTDIDSLQRARRTGGGL